MKKLRFLFIGLILGIIISVFADQLSYKPVPIIEEHYHIKLTQDWYKTANSEELKYYNHLLNYKP